MLFIIFPVPIYLALQTDFIESIHCVNGLHSTEMVHNNQIKQVRTQLIVAET